jgi:hypothetical protein
LESVTREDTPQFKDIAIFFSTGVGVGVGVGVGSGTSPLPEEQALNRIMNDTHKNN